MNPATTNTIAIIIASIIIGLLAGGLGRFLLPGEQKMGLIKTCLYGIGGSLIGGFVVNKLHFNPFIGSQFLFSVLGAMLLLWIGQTLQNRA